MRATKEKVQFTQQEQELARFAKALSHPMRVAILNYLEKQLQCYTGDLVDIFPMAQSTISQHIKELKEAGLIQGEINLPKTRYCVNQDNWKKAKRLFADFFNVDFKNLTCEI